MFENVIWFEQQIEFGEENYHEWFEGIRYHCKWYIWVAVGYVIGKNLSDTLGGLIGLAIGGLIGCYIQKNHSKKDDW